MSSQKTTVARMLVSAFVANDVKRIFGVPGGGSSLDVIEAADDAGIEFILTRSENSAVMMAAATAELDGSLGVALMTKGPGVANAANGVAYAALDRAPVVILTDGFTAEQETFITHQVFDQRALLDPLAKSFMRLHCDTSADEISALIQNAFTAPLGPVQIELTGADAKSRVSKISAPAAAASLPDSIDENELVAAADLIKESVRPVVIVGLEAREKSTAKALIEFAEALGCPVLTTYKAKGVISDSHDLYGGIFTGGAAESDCVSQADLIILCGVDPVEFVLQKWRYNAAVLDVSTIRHDPHYTPIATGLYGSIAGHLDALRSDCTTSEWMLAEISSLREKMLTALSYPAGNVVGPQQVIEAIVDRAGADGVRPRLTVDAGAHMFSAMAFWQCDEPCDVLISNGLATMAFALPAAIAAALHDPDRPVAAITGDGGLLMCLGELLTAVEQQARIIVIVMNDGSLSLIDIKQQQRQMPPRGVRWEPPDFAQMMIGMGGGAVRIRDESEIEAAVNAALGAGGPFLIDVLIDPGGYPEQLKALRG